MSVHSSSGLKKSSGSSTNQGSMCLEKGCHFEDTTQKKREEAMMKPLIPTYDEATSGSDDDDDSSSSSDDEGAVEVEQQESGDASPSAANDDSSDTDGDSGDSDNDSSSENESRPNDPNDDDSNNNNNEEEEDLPLYERIHRNEQKGISLRESRKRKSKAIQVAIQRLKPPQQQQQKEEDHHSIIVKKSKHAPAEVSSKRSDFFRRGAPKLNESGIGVEIGAHRYKPLDPRASNLHGHFNEEQFEQNYEFLEQIRQKEISQLKKQIVARKITGKRGQSKRRRMGITDQGSLEEDKEKLKALMQEKADLERRKLNRSAKQAVKKKMQEQVEQGKGGAFFLKRKEKRRLELEAKMEVIRNKGGNAAVDKAVNKRRKKQKTKDAKIFAKRS